MINVSQIDLRTPVQVESPPAQVKEPYSSLQDYFRLSSCKTGVYNVRLLIILERGCTQEFEFISIEQETRPKKAISNKRVWKTSKEWNIAIFISGYQKCKVALQDVISAIFLGTYPALNTSIYTLSTYARQVIINPVLRIKILLFQINFATLPQNWSPIARSEHRRLKLGPKIIKNR